MINKHGQDAGATHGGRAGAGVWGCYTPADGGRHKENTPHWAGWFGLVTVSFLPASQVLAVYLCQAIQAWQASLAATGYIRATQGTSLH